MGAGRYARARKVARTATAISAATTGALGLVATLVPEARLHLFSREEAVVQVGSAYSYALRLSTQARAPAA